MLRNAVSYCNKRQGNGCCQNAGKLFFRFFSCIFQTLYRRFIFRKVDALLFFEFSYEVVDDDLVEVVAAKLVVSTCCFNFKETIA